MGGKSPTGEYSTKSNATMRAIARATAIKQGAKEITGKSGNRVAAYTINKTDLQRIFELNGFNTKGVGWLNMCDRWRIMGEYVPDVETLKTTDGWYIVFLMLDEDEKYKLEAFAHYHGIEKVMG